MLEHVAHVVGEEFDVIGLASDGRAAVDAALALSPDVVVLDVSMPIISGLTAAAEILNTSRPPRVVMLTMHDDPTCRHAALEVGAHGFVLKTRLVTDLLPAIHAALAATEHA